MRTATPWPASAPSRWSGRRRRTGGVLRPSSAAKGRSDASVILGGGEAAGCGDADEGGGGGFEREHAGGQRAERPHGPRITDTRVNRIFGSGRVLLLSVA